jgi:hypothetical protein
MKSISHHPISKRERSQSPALFRLILAFTLFLSVFFYSTRAAYPSEVSLIWDPVIHSDLAGYKIFHREESEVYDYGSPVWTGTETSCTVLDLDEHTSYCFVARAFDTFGNESDDSNEVCWPPAPDSNTPPVLGTIGSKSVNEGVLLTFTLSASDPDGDGLTFSASNLPTGASFNPSTRVFSWTPAFGSAGNYNVTFTVTDNGTPSESDSEVITITVGDPSVGNLAPDQPVITSPYYGETEADLLLTVETDHFSDPDGNTHKESRWQIVKQQDSSVVLDSTSSGHLTELPVPHTVLDRNTTYSVSVQFYDSYSEPSVWSDPIEFTTTADIVDFDGDGIPDDSEVDDSVDLNEDGIPDNDQDDVIKSVQSAVAGHVAVGVCMDSTTIDEIEVLETVHPSDILDKKNKPQKFAFGLFSYRLRVNQPGDIATVRIYYSEDISGAEFFYMYDSIKGWRDYTQYATFNEDGRSVTVELRDGANGDSDGVANGVIVDPGGVVGAATVGADSGAGGGCFIATAAFGSYMEPNVKLLREFRDLYLLTNRPGRRFVEVYYHYGPLAADYIEEHDWLKPIVRLALMPLVGISYVLVKGTLALLIPVGLVLFTFILVYYRIKRKPVIQFHRLRLT